MPAGPVREACLIRSDTGARGVLGFILVGVVGWRRWGFKVFRGWGGLQFVRDREMGDNCTKRKELPSETQNFVDWNALTV